MGRAYVCVKISEYPPLGGVDGDKTAFLSLTKNSPLLEQHLVLKTAKRA